MTIHYPKNIEELDSIVSETEDKQGDSYDWYSTYDYGGYPASDKDMIGYKINEGCVFTRDKQGQLSPDPVRIILGNEDVENVRIEVPLSVFENWSSKKDLELS